jgi:hypothetical protein
MRATGFNHVSIHARNLDESTRYLRRGLRHGGDVPTMTVGHQETPSPYTGN